MDPANKKIWAFSSVSGAALPTPTGLAVDSKLVYAASANTSQVVVFDKEGRQLSALGKADGIKRPVGLAVDEARDLLVVVNGDEHAVRLYTRSLKLIKTIGGRGNEEGQFNFPSYICIVPGVGFAVADTGNFRIQIFDFNGKFLRTFGKVGDMPGQFARPKGLAVDPDGHLYVVDGTFSNFQIFNQDGRILTFVGTGGVRKGQFQTPNGIAIGADGGIYVADQTNGRIQKFQYLREEKEAPASNPSPQ
jgi:DNA-binding beta-propeller fold protein YncE